MYVISYVPIFDSSIDILPENLFTEISEEFAVNKPPFVKLISLVGKVTVLFKHKIESYLKFKFGSNGLSKIVNDFEISPEHPPGL